MDRYMCLICGHVYDPAKGEVLQDIKPGIDFPALPTDWECPVCGAKKDMFRLE